MSLRSSRYYGGSAAFWVFLAFLQLVTNVCIYHFSSLFVIGLAACGVIVGISLGFVISQRRLHSIEKKGEHAYSLSTILYAIGGLIIFTGVSFIIAPRVPLEVLVSVLLFVAPMPSGGFAVSALAFFSWERRHGKLIYNSPWSSKIYVFPKMEQPLQP